MGTTVSNPGPGDCCKRPTCDGFFDIPAEELPGMIMITVEADCGLDGLKVPLELQYSTGGTRSWGGDNIPVTPPNWECPWLFYVYDAQYEIRRSPDGSCRQSLQIVFFSEEMDGGGLLFFDGFDGVSLPFDFSVPGFTDGLSAPSLATCMAGCEGCDVAPPDPCPNTVVFHITE